MDDFVGDRGLLNNDFERGRNSLNRSSYPHPKTVKNSPDKFDFEKAINLSENEVVPRISKFNSAVSNKSKNKKIYLKSMRENGRKNEFTTPDELKS